MHSQPDDPARGLAPQWIDRYTDTQGAMMRRAEVLRILGEHRHEFTSFGVISVKLFGSVARDEASEFSDIDVLAEFERPLTFRRYMDFRFFLEDLLGIKVDLVTERGLRDRVRPQVERDAIRVA
jgi:predicted nucleotidyltransferase